MFCGALKATVRRVNNAMDCCHPWFWSECLFGIWDRCTWQRPISHKYYHNRSMNMIYKRIREKFIYHIVRQSNALERDTRPHHRSDLICNVCIFVFFSVQKISFIPHIAHSHTLCMLFCGCCGFYRKQIGALSKWKCHRKLLCCGYVQLRKLTVN